MLLSAEQIKTRTPQANDAIQQSFAVLRFYTAQQTNELIEHCKSIMARLLEDISSQTCQAKEVLDLLAQEHLELLIPKMRSARRDTVGDRSRCDLSSVVEMSKKIEATVRERTGVIDERLELTVSKPYLVAPYISEPVFRDIDKALVLMQELDNANIPIETQSIQSANEVLAIGAILESKQRNLAIEHVQNLRSLTSAYASAKKVFDACYVAQILRKELGLLSSQDVEAFLMKSLEDLMQLSWDALERYYQ